MYKDDWTYVIGENLICAIEDDNYVDKNAVAITRGNKIVGHVPREHSRVFSFFIKRGGTISCEVTGEKYNAGLKGLEVPAAYTFTGVEKDTTQLKKLLKIQY